MWDYHLCCGFLWLFLCFQLCLCKNDGHNEACQMGGISGACVALPECTKYLVLLKNTETLDEGLKVTQARHCGFEGHNMKVCCPMEDLARTVSSTEAPFDTDDFVEALPKPGQCGSPIDSGYQSFSNGYGGGYSGSGYSSSSSNSYGGGYAGPGYGSSSNGLGSNYAGPGYYSSSSNGYDGNYPKGQYPLPPQSTFSHQPGSSIGPYPLGSPSYLGPPSGQLPVRRYPDESQYRPPQTQSPFGVSSPYTFPGADPQYYQPPQTQSPFGISPPYTYPGSDPQHYRPPQTQPPLGISPPYPYPEGPNQHQPSPPYTYEQWPKSDYGQLQYSPVPPPLPSSFPGGILGSSTFQQTPPPYIDDSFGRLPVRKYHVNQTKPATNGSVPSYLEGKPHVPVQPLALAPGNEGNYTFNPHDKPVIQHISSSFNYPYTGGGGAPAIAGGAIIGHGKRVESRDLARWMAVLGYKGDSVFWQCGGTIITARHVLTAAHCIKKNLYVVRVGEIDLASEERDYGPIDILVKKAIKHEQYTKFHNDIAVQVLQTNIDFVYNPHITPLCLPSYSDAATMKQLEQSWRGSITGWGETETIGERPTHLLYAYVNILPSDKCVAVFGRNNVTIDARVLCAGDSSHGRDACDGDSGGPLASEIYVERLHGWYYYQRGIVSYGFPCKKKRYTGVYTNVTHYLGWIEEKVLGRRTTLN